MTLRDRLFRFEGRLRRRDWWLFSGLILLAQVVGGVAVLLLLPAVGLSSPLAASLASIAIYLALQWPSAAINVRRFHDRDRPGWPGVAFVVLLALFFVAQLAGLSLVGLMQQGGAVGAAFSLLALVWMPVPIWMLIVLGLADGTPGPNRYGPSPKAPL